jgi:hypothetical protein
MLGAAPAILQLWNFIVRHPMLDLDTFLPNAFWCRLLMLHQRAESGLTFFIATCGNTARLPTR